MGLFNRGVNEDVLRGMHEAGWFPADPITLRTSIEIVGSVVLDRPALFITTGKRMAVRSGSARSRSIVG